MMDAPELERRDRLAVDIDLRMAQLWAEALGPDSLLARVMGRNEQVRDEVGALVRAAYGKGYIDALQEDKDGRRAELHRAHGYKPE